MITGESWSVLSSDMDNLHKADDVSFSLFNRLLDDRNERLRAFVRDLTVEDAGGLKEAEGLEQPEHPLTSLITKASLARRARQDSSESPDALCPKQQELVLSELFAAYPNLSSLSVSVNRRVIGCRRGLIVSTTRLQPLTSFGDWDFPPLQNLSLSGYFFREHTEISIWRERFPWEGLQSLSLGPRKNENFLEQLGGRLQFLTRFKNTANCNETPSSNLELNLFLSSFHGLESLILEGYEPTLEVVTHHPNLKHLCLHAIESPDREGQTLSTKELEILDRSCPEITTLEIDVNPESAWSDTFIDALAMGFQRLRRLSIHIALGMVKHKGLEGQKSMEAGFQVVLTDSKAQDFGTRFFERRGPKSVLEIITLRTGENLRHFTQWSPTYVTWERQAERIFEIHPPRKIGDEPFLKELPNRDVRFRQRVNRKFAHVSGKESPRISRRPRQFQNLPIQ
ncbi:hypothetical protein N7486_002831 [Penicillium sp. IBT 16267x]|nr:hypothetical protein N7486_002831 [Penicillium sp. IBT 16267x]